MHRGCSEQLPDIWKRNKDVARRNPGLIIDGVLEFRDGVTNLVARSFTPIETNKQSRLSEAGKLPCEPSSSGTGR